MRSMLKGFHLFVVTILALLTPLAVLASDDNSLEWKGVVNSHPADGHVGIWDIGGNLFEATSTTRFEYEQAHPDLDSIIGMCVEVTYQVNGNTNVATEISETESADCASDNPGDDGNTPPDDGSVDNPDDGSNDDGSVDNPDDGSNDDGSVDNPDDGSNDDRSNDDGSDDDGSDDNPDDGSDDNPDDGSVDNPDDGSNDDGSSHSVLRFYGIVTTIPTSYIGTWVIGGETFVSTPATWIETSHKHDYDHDHEALAVGSCARVSYLLVSGVKTASSILPAEHYACDNGTTTNRGFGVVVSFPDTLTGTWVIQTSASISVTLETTATTRFDQEHGTFAVGDCVSFVYSTQNGVSTLLKIEHGASKYCRIIHHDSEDDDTKPPSLPDYSKVYATIDEVPDPYQGVWIIGGISYTATVKTRFEQEHSTFEVGACVKAAYTTDDNGVRTLLKLEAEESYKCTDEEGNTLFKSYGAIETMPMTTTLPGEWQIGGVTYMVTTTTQLKQHHGVFSIGAYVEVKYTVEDGVRVAVSIKTHVAPHAGLHHAWGRYHGRKVRNGWDTWDIGGRIFYCDPAMEVEDTSNTDSTSDGTTTQLATVTTQASPIIGELVEVNYYEGADGNNYITYVSPSTVSQTFLPVIIR